MKMTKIILLTLTGSFAAGLGALAQTATLPPASTKEGVTYDTDIKAIFDSSCVKCHGAQKPKARLQLNSLAGALKGSKDGPILKVGDSANSFIVKSTAHLTQDQDSWMPPLKNKAGIKPLTADQIGLIRAWIDQGAK